MNETFYNMIFKRKSFHIFRNVEGEITEEELKTIEEKYKAKDVHLTETATIIVADKEGLTARKQRWGFPGFGTQK